MQRRRAHQARCAEDSGNSGAEEEDDEARCSDDIGSTRAEQEDDAVGYLVGRLCWLRARAVSRCCSERNWMIGSRRLKVHFNASLFV
jgi:hypothetical protein